MEHRNLIGFTRRMLVIVGLALISRVLFAQADNQIEWNQRELQLGDYLLSVAPDAKESNTSIEWQFGLKTFKSQDYKWLRIRYVDIGNYFIPGESWLKPDVGMLSKLKYEQLKFDISEYYCRKVERTANMTGEVEKALADYKDSLAYAILQLSELTDDGKNQTAVDSMQTIVKEKLSGTEIPYPEIRLPEKKGFYWGLGLFEQCLFRTGEMTRLLPTPVSCMNIELTAGYNRLAGSIGVSCQTTGDWLRSKEEFQYQQSTYPKDAYCEDLRYYVYLSYAVYENERIQIRPFIGAGITYMSFLHSLGLKDFSSPHYMAGVSADCCLLSKWELSKRYTTNYLLNGRVYVCKENIAGYSGYSINVGIGFSPWFIKTK